MLLGYLCHADHLLIKAQIKVMGFVQNICDSSAHARCEVFSGAAENDGATTCHILAAVVSAALGYCKCAGISDAEALSRDAVYICLSAGCPI